MSEEERKAGVEKDSERGGDREGRKGGHREQIGERGRKKEGIGCFPKAQLFSQSSSSLIPPCDADTKGEAIVCIIKQSTGQKSPILSALFRAKGGSERCQRQFYA